MVMTSRRPQIQADEFERIAATAERDLIRLEFVDGKMGVKPVPDGDHDEIIRWITRQCLQLRPDLWLYPERGLKIETYRQGRAKPDGVLAADGSFAGQGEWADPEQVLMAVEVTSYDSDADRRDRRDKPRAYAETGIPIYLMIDRDAGETFVYSHLSDGVYTTITRVRFGSDIELPEPLCFDLDTEPFKNWVR